MTAPALTPLDWTRAERLWRQGEPAAQIALALRCTEADVRARATAEDWDRVPQRPATVRGAASCPTCHRALDVVREAAHGVFTGRIVTVHPPVPCVPRVARPTRERRTCSECPATYLVDLGTMTGRRLVCSDACGLQRKYRLAAQRRRAADPHGEAVRERGRRHWQAKVAARERVA